MAVAKVPATQEHYADRQLAWWSQRLNSPSFVYVIQTTPGTPIKIGVAKNVAARIATLQTGNPYRLRLLHVFPGGYELEWQLHQKLAKHRLGGEWFSAEGAEPSFPWMLRFADALIAAYDGSGVAPSYRQPGFAWRRYKPSERAIVVRYITPEPVAPEVASERLAAAWMGPRRAGDWHSSVEPRVGSIV